jgi:hypothetical protein
VRLDLATDVSKHPTLAATEKPDRAVRTTFIANRCSICGDAPLGTGRLLAEGREAVLPPCGR